LFAPGALKVICNVAVGAACYQWLKTAILWQAAEKLNILSASIGSVIPEGAKLLSGIQKKQ
jgi:hypothetical protein